MSLLVIRVCKYETYVSSIHVTIYGWIIVMNPRYLLEAKKSVGVKIQTKQNQFRHRAH